MRKFLIVWTMVTIIFGSICIGGTILRVQDEREKQVKEFNISLNENYTTKSIKWDNTDEVIGFLFFEVPIIFLFWGCPIGLACLITLSLKKR